MGFHRRDMLPPVVPKHLEPSEMRQSLLAHSDRLAQRLHEYDGRHKPGYSKSHDSQAAAHQPEKHHVQPGVLVTRSLSCQRRFVIPGRILRSPFMNNERVLKDVEIWRYCSQAHIVPQVHYNCLILMSFHSSFGHLGHCHKVAC